MNWQDQTYRNGAKTGARFIDIDDDGTKLRVFNKNGKIWAMFYPKAKDENHYWQPFIGNLLGGEKAVPTSKQMDEWHKIAIAATQPKESERHE
jgi:hypothetical protein